LACSLPGLAPFETLHDDVADHHKSTFLPCTLQNAQEEIAARAGSQLGPPLVAATGYEMQIVPAVPAFQAFRHTLSLVVGQMCVGDETHAAP